MQHDGLGTEVIEIRALAADADEARRGDGGIIRHDLQLIVHEPLQLVADHFETQRPGAVEESGEVPGEAELLVAVRASARRFQEDVGLVFAVGGILPEAAARRNAFVSSVVRVGFIARKLTSLGGRAGLGDVIPSRWQRQQGIHGGAGKSDVDKFR